MAMESALEISLPENTLVIRPKDNQITAAIYENEPDNWAQAVAGQVVTWTGLGPDNKIAKNGGTLVFPVAFTTPSITEEKSYTIKVRAKPKGGTSYVVEKLLTLIVDGKTPTATISTSKFWANANENITITVTADEPLAGLDNVRVKENKGDWVQLTMSPADTENKVWTGTYLTSDNVERDGQAIIQVCNFQDLSGNTTALKENWFMIDRTAPAAISLNAETGFPGLFGNTGKRITDNSSYTFAVSIPYENSVIDPYGENNSSIQTVRIRVGTEVYDMTLVGGNWTRELTLPEGITE
ncbi:MAG: Ig-like domain-containing protein, partial [Candidatus Hadarchaeales archaeon]